MKCFYRNLIVAVLFSLLVPIKGFATHIVGGTITYTYNGGNNYTIMLKLYRDCTGIAFPGSATINVLQANGSVFAPSRNFTLPGGTITNIPAVLPPCATSPSVTPCVQERIYTATVNLAPSPGGMHLYYSLCCRNPSILNINTPGAVGETFYCYIPCYFDTWKEDFTLPAGTTVDAGATAWTRSFGAIAPASAQVNAAGEFEVTGANNGRAIWASQVVNISSFANGVNMSVNTRRAGTMANGDSLKIFYSLNGGPKTLFAVNGQLLGNFVSPVFSTQPGLIGNTIQVFIHYTFNATSPATKIYANDMVTIYDNTFVPNSNPSFANLPPLFLCSTNTFSVNQAATDGDGDVLVYSMYTPYNDAPAPTFPNNTAFIPPVTFIPNYSANSPFNSPAPAVTLNSSTGLMTGVANTNGQFVFGVKVQEYRGGRLLSETVRDYQMNTVTCPPFIPPPPTPGANTPLCIGQTLSLTASPVAGATYQWSGPNGFTSTLQNPTISNVTALAAGVYTVQAIVAGCTGIAATITVTINPNPTAPTAGGTSPICVGQTLSLSSNTVAGATYNWSGPNSFTSAVQNPTIGGITLAGAGTYSATVTVSGCTSPPGTVNIVVNNTPTVSTLTSNAPICAGQTLSLTANAGGGATYSWTGPNSFTSTTQNPTIVGTTTLASGVYSVNATALGCVSATGTINVLVNPIPASPTPGSNSPICTGQTLSLTASSVAGATYNWSGPNSFTSTTQNPTIPGVSVLNAGTYSISATLAGCTSPVTTLSVTINNPPIAPTATANIPVCIGGNLNLGASTIAGATYNWVGPNSFTSSVQNPTITGVTLPATGVYSVNANVMGCIGPMGTVNVVITPLPPSPTAGSNSPLCSGQTLFLTASSIAGASYNWSGPNSFTANVQNPSIVSTSSLATGVYSVSAVVGGCASPSGTVNVLVNPTPPAPTAGSNSPICEGQTLLLTANPILFASYNWTGPNSFTSTAQNPTIAATTTLAAGVYSVSASVSGCVGPIGTVTVVINPTPVPVVPSSNSPLCTGQTLSLTANTIVGGVYSWTGPNTFTSSVQNPTLSAVTISESGTYSVNVTVAGCTGSSGTVSVIVNPPVPAPTLGSNSPLCEGQDILLTASNITGATYNWTGPNTFTSSVQNPTVTPTTTLSAGVYSVQANVSGCNSPVATVTVTVNPTPAAPTATANSPLCEGQTLLLSASTVTGTTYSWTGPNSFTSTVQNPTIVATTSLAAGVYSVNVTSGGCTSSNALVTVTVNPLPDPVIAGSNSPLCVGATLSLTASNITGAVYNWTGPNSFTSSVQNPTITNVTLLESGTYSVNVTVAGCTGTSGTVSVLVSPPVAAPTATATSPICEGQDIYLTSSTITGATYNWTGPNSFTAAVQNPTVTPTTTLSAGVYSVQATVAGCTGPYGTVSVTVNPTPAPPTLGANSPICAGQTLSLTATSVPGGTYSWTGPNSFTAATQDSTIMNATTAASGDYSLTVTLGGCTSTVAIISVTVNSTPAAPTATANSPLCVGATINLGASAVGATTYSWTGPNSFTSSVQNPTITNASTLTAGVYSVYATIGSCDGAATTITVNVTDPAVVYAGPNDTICASALILPLSGTVTPGYNTTWTSLGTGTIANTSSLITTYTMSSNDTISGSVTFVLTSSGGGCANTSDTVTFIVLKGPNVFAGADINVCKNAAIPLNGNITGVTNTGFWTTTGSGTFNPNNTTLNGFYQPSSSDTASTGIQLILESTNNKGCVPARDTINVNFINAPSSAFTFTNACANQPVSFTDISTPVGTVTSYTWNFGDGSGTSNNQNPTYTYTVGNTYTVTLITSNSAGCTDTVQQPVTVFIAPVANFTFSNVCVGTLGTFNDASTVSTGSITNWSWTFGDGGSSTLQNPSHTYTTSGSFTVNLTVVSSNGCTGTITQTVTVNPKPVADFSMSGNPVYSTDVVTFTDLSTPTGSIVGWNWNLGDGTTSTNQNVQYYYDNNGVFTVQLAITDASGCMDTVSKEIIVVLLPQVPTAFTPNGDGHNDFLFVKGGPFQTLYFRVYNNWGQLLFETTDQKVGWDGTYKGEKVQLGVYVWVLDVDMFDGTHIRKTGDITILK